ncbi:MAG: AsmA family protein [Terracidiphilus sp.]
MTNGAASREKLHGRLRIALAIVAILVLALVVPPLISVNHYKGQITSLISQSLGRPVRLSSVKVRLLPWPGFVLSDLSVAEDPAYGAEPVLYASQVTASLRLLALWRGRLEIDTISVDEASLNVVRAAPGKWNLDPLFRTAAAQTGASGNASTRGSEGATSQRAVRLPSLEATNLRIDVKNGAEKLPFSLVNADLSVWQARSGEWRIRLRGQPARTDVSLHQEETGVVRMEASVHSAPALSQMPLHLYLNWREAQLGQLARLVTGSDSGWRGDVTGELHVDGTADAAQVAVRLRASSVRRAEFAPASPLDFDANCGFLYHYDRRSLEKLVCDSPLGDGHMRLTGEKLGLGLPPQFAVEFDRIPVAAGLDALRTLRSSIDPGLEASGTISGKIVYASSPASNAPAAKSGHGKHARKAAAEPAGPFAGSLTVSDFALTGGGLSKPVQAPKIVFEPSATPHASVDALAGTVAISAGGEAPLAFNLRFSFAGYQVGVRGQAAIARARELAHAAGIPESQALASVAGDPLTVDLVAAGPWMPQGEIFLAATDDASPPTAAHESSAPSWPSSAIPADDSLTGTVTLHNANWKAGYLANHVQIAEATLHLDGTGLRWDPVVFSYGPVKGTAVLRVPLDCPTALPEPQSCPAQFQVQFNELDAGTVQAALLGAKEKSTLLSDLIDRLHPSASPPWPALEGTVKADALVLGPTTLHAVSAGLRILPTGATVENFHADLFGGSVQFAGSVEKPATDRDKPVYTFEGDFQKLNVTQLGSLLGLRWSGASLNGNGKITLTGYTAKDLAASAHGALHFACGHGAIGNQPSKSSKPERVPAPISRFDRWTADATIADGVITLDRNVVIAGSRKQSVAATVTLADPPAVSFTQFKQPAAKH